ncbi:transcription elongation factor GreA [Paenibacillus pasadenensis]|uniref:transcription elongation factor GreA n=1 Tax=Paenibacillus pasadenensis TaxID=217090 RepID=UPI00203BE710|nr:transcription elongation factor GreA [Paenibacillus pasadenensis]MCM3747788.1 transcription elongation factor GreA [Paenibacillus pasadenensis]
MANEEIILTPEGLAKLEAELEELKGPKRRELAQRIKTAISYGDLKENSEYHSAKEDQAFMETRILQIQAMLKKARVADSSDTSKVTVGSIVSLLDQEFDEKLDYRIVSPAEADVMENRISYESPLGKTLIGKQVGDVVEVDAPIGKIKYKVLAIRSL